MAMDGYLWLLSDSFFLFFFFFFFQLMYVI